MAENKLVELDVREDLRNKQEPFQKIMGAVQSLEQVGDVFILHAIFEPVPLLTVFKSKGFDNEVEKIAEDHWKITFTKTS